MGNVRPRWRMEEVVAMPDRPAEVDVLQELLNEHRARLVELLEADQALRDRMRVAPAALPPPNDVIGRGDQAAHNLLNQEEALEALRRAHEEGAIRADNGLFGRRVPDAPQALAPANQEPQFEQAAGEHQAHVRFPPVAAVHRQPIGE